MTFDYSDEPGWPAESTRVYVDPTRIGPHVMRRDDREAGLEAQAKYYEANKERERLRVREAMRRLRAERATS